MSLRNTPPRSLLVVVALGLLPFATATGCSNGKGTKEQEHHGGEEHAGAGHEEAGAGNEVHLDAEQRQAAGVKTVVARAGKIADTLRLVARVESNGDTIVHVTPRVEGIVQKIYKGLGEKVAAGDPLVELWSIELGNTVSSYLEQHARLIAAKETLTQSKKLFEGRLLTLTRVLDGEIAVAQRIFEREKQLQEKSISTIRPFLEADKELQRARLAKDRELTSLEAERDSKLLELQMLVRQGTIEEESARNRLIVLGFSDQEVAAYHGAAEHGTRLQNGKILIRAPRAGIILDRSITLNEHVGTDRTLFKIHDLSTIWIIASAYEKDLRSLRTGQDVLVHLDALPGLSLPGKITQIGYRISESTRAAPVRIELGNAALEEWPEEFPLRPGMFGNVEVVVRSWQGRVVVSERALVHEGEENFVFVANPDEDGSFLRKAVTVRKGANDLVEIVRGVDPGERIAVDGVFLLKSMARTGELGEGHSH